MNQNLTEANNQAQYPYSWDDIEPYIKEKLSQAKSIMTFGTIGSRNVQHDIDIIVTKKTDASTSQYYKEIHELLDGLDAYLKGNYGKKLIKFTKFAHQEEFLYIGNYQLGDLALHVMNYSNLEHMKQIWAPDLKNGEDIETILRENFVPLCGSKEFLFSEDFKHRKMYDGLLLKLDEQDRTNAHYPESLLVNSSNHLYKYVLKYLGAQEKCVAKDRQEVREYFYKILDQIDMMNNLEQKMEG
jgi:hypothetical protein